MTDLFVWWTVIHSARRHSNREVRVAVQSDPGQSCAKMNQLTVADAEVSGTPSDLSPVWGTRTGPLKHTCKGSDEKMKR